jgi:type III restriction enzyme
VCDVFAGQPYLTPSYMMDRGYVKNEQITLDESERFTGFGNSKLVPELNDGVIFENINRIQRSNQIEPSKQLEGRYNLTVEMEIGVGNWKSCSWRSDPQSRNGRAVRA